MSERESAVTREVPALVRLNEILSSYPNRRTVEARMVEEVVGLARLAQAETSHAAEQRRAELAESHSREVGRLQLRLLRTAQELQDAEAKLAQRRTLVDEARSLGELGAEVTLKQPESGWSVGAIEEVAYRLRTAGASDHTAIVLSAHVVRASVPNPNLVHIAPAEPPAPRQRQPHSAARIFLYIAVALAFGICILATGVGR